MFALCVLLSFFFFFTIIFYFYFSNYFILQQWATTRLAYKEELQIEKAALRTMHSCNLESIFTRKKVKTHVSFPFQRTSTIQQRTVIFLVVIKYLTSEKNTDLAMTFMTSQRIIPIHFSVSSSIEKFGKTVC